MRCYVVAANAHASVRRFIGRTVHAVRPPPVVEADCTRDPAALHRALTGPPVAGSATVGTVAGTGGQHLTALGGAAALGGALAAGGALWALGSLLGAAAVAPGVAVYAPLPPAAVASYAVPDPLGVPGAGITLPGPGTPATARPVPPQPIPEPAALAVMAAAVLATVALRQRSPRTVDKF